MMTSPRIDRLLDNVDSNYASVLVAAVGVAVTGSAWPDIGVGLAIAAMFASSAVTVIRDARRRLSQLAAG